MRWASAMNGMALHGGFISLWRNLPGVRRIINASPGDSGFLALMEQRVIYVMTHDSIGLGEDGPTHQPVEHLASLRVIPNLYVFRPADATETAECWALALSLKDSPSILSLTRQTLPALRTEYTKDEFVRTRGLRYSDQLPGEHGAGGEKMSSLLIDHLPLVTIRPQVQSLHSLSMHRNGAGG